MTVEHEITFYITNTAGGTAVDLDKTILTYTDNDDFVTEEYSASGNWTYDDVVNNGGPVNLIEKGEKYKIIIDLTNLLL